MNFGRRLLDGAINAVSAQPNTPSSSASPGLSIPIIKPNPGPSWPPSSPINPVPNSPLTPTNPDSSPQASVPGLGLLSKSRPVANARKVGTSIDITSPPGGPQGGGNDTMSITRSDSLAQPRPVRANGMNNGILGGARKELPSLSRIKTPTPSQTPPLPTMPKWQAASAMLSAKEELLLELLSSEAILDSRDCEILESDQVEELKRELQILSTRLYSASKKLSLQTKIRDAAISLSKLHPSKPSSTVNGTPNEKVSAENRKVDTARTELTRISDRLIEVQRRLWEHRSGVLSYTVTKLEKELRPSTQANGGVSGRCTPANGRNRSSEHSPTSSSVSGTSRIPSKFEGPHLFAGHEGAALPIVPKLPATTAVLEERLKSLEESLAASRKAEEDLKADLKRVRLQKSELENSLGAQLQTAEDEIATLQGEVERMRQMREQLDERMVENRELATRNRELEAEVGENGRRLREAEKEMKTLQREQGKAEGMENVVSQVRQGAKLELDRKDEELRAIKERIAQERENWLKERQALEDEKLEDLSQLQQEFESSQTRDATTARIAEEELEAASKALQTLVRTHRVLTMGEERDVPSLVAAVGAHMEALADENGKKAKAQEDRDTLRRKLEDDLRASLDRRDKLGQEVETARNEREEARRDLRMLEERLREYQNGSERSQPFDIPPVMRLRSGTQSSTAVSEGDDKSKDKARAAKVSNKGFMQPNSPLLTPNGRHGDGTATSLSELDVRALKSLYDPRLGSGSPLFSSFSNATDFSIDAFEQRVRALLADDRAIIERLIRFAQAHDLLKNNAERAQKLAEESAVSLKTYQKQVKSLEDRNATIVQKQQSLIEEIDSLQRGVEKLQREKRELELQTADQTETCKNLQDANNTLSARALALAEEVATAPEAMRIKMEAQLTEVRRQLKEAQEDIDAMRNAEQSQRLALLDELNIMQSDNTKLREQLRVAQRK